VVARVERSRAALFVLSIAGACAAPTATAVPAQARADAPPTAPHDDAWREVFDAAGWPHIGRATRITSRRMRMSGGIVCVEGWHVRTERGPIVLFDDLHVEWGAMFWEHWPEAQRVPVDRYDDLPDLRPMRTARGRSSGTPPRFVIGSTAEFLAQIVGPDCAHPASGPLTPSTRLFHVARARWAEMLGHPGLSTLLREREAWAFRHDDELHDEVARVLTEETRFALSRGMSRREARVRFQRARSIVRSTDLERAIEATLRDLGDDPPPWPAEPSLEDLVAALADEPYFPARRWEADGPRPTWARGEALEPASPAWELVARGWDALPALRDASRSTRSTRRFRPRITSEGVITLVGSSVDRLALSVASMIAGRAFADADALDHWWLAVGVHGRKAAWLSAIAAPDEHVALHGIVGELVRAGDPDVWPAVRRALADRRHPRRADLLWALEPEPDDGSASSRDAERARRLARRYRHDPERDVRVAAASLLMGSADERE
jgi:hypothetical protein